MTLTDRTLLGRAGESAVRKYLERHGYQFVEANWHCRAGELDLVMRDADILVFVEVKTRHGESAGRAEESLRPRQSARILSAAEWFVSEHPELSDLIWRVDLVGVTLDPSGAVARLTHWQNAVVTG